MRPSRITAANIKRRIHPSKTPSTAVRRRAE
jgi:hypothetical protein